MIATWISFMVRPWLGHCRDVQDENSGQQDAETDGEVAQSLALTQAFAPNLGVCRRCTRSCDLAACGSGTRGPAGTRAPRCIQASRCRFVSALRRNDATTIGDHMSRSVACHEPLEIDAGRVLVLMHSNQKPVQVLERGIHCCSCSARQSPPAFALIPLTATARAGSSKPGSGPSDGR